MGLLWRRQMQGEINKDGENKSVWKATNTVDNGGRDID